MNGLTLVIGSKNGSSWSLRPWLLMKQAGLPFEEILVPLRRPDTARRIRTYSPSGKVPVLLAGHQRIWDSLAIAEFLAEQNPKLWPEDPQARAFARSICAEMHSGFSALRTFLPMDFTARFGPPGMLLSSVGADIDRVLEIWAECRERHCRPGPFLFGSFTIADAMFAPVCSRFTTYAIPLDPHSRTYVAYMMALPAMQEWGRGAAAEVAHSAAEAPPAAEAFWDDEPVTPPLKVVLAVPEVALEPASKTAVEAPRPVPLLPEAAPMRPPERPAPQPALAQPPAPAPKTVVEAPRPEPAPPATAPVRPPEPPAPKPVAAQPELPPTRIEPRPVAPPPPPQPRVATPPEPPPTRVEPRPAAPERPFTPPPYADQAPDELRRGPRPIPSTIMVKPIGDGTRRRR